MQYSAIFYICLNVFLYADVYELWGNFNLSMVTISGLQITCALYTFFLAYTNSTTTLNCLHSAWNIFRIIAIATLIPVAVVTFLAAYGFQQSDHVANFTATSNILSYASLTLVPFLAILALTYVTWNMRAYEIDDSDIDFQDDYHFGPAVVTYSRKGKKMAKKAKLSEELAIKLLQ